MSSLPATKLRSVECVVSTCRSLYLGGVGGVSGGPSPADIGAVLAEINPGRAAPVYPRAKDRMGFKANNGKNCETRPFVVRSYCMYLP